MDANSLMRQIIASYRLAVAEDSARAYGYTLSLFEDWPSDVPAPDFLHLIEADILQHGHDFEAARQRLATVLQQDPGNSQALQMLAQVSLVMADYQRVDEACSELRAHGYEVLAVNCRAQLDGLTGASDAALSSTEFILESRDLSAGERLELHITAATIAHRLGRVSLAERHYREALAASPDSHYVLINFSQLLQEQGRHDEVVRLLRSQDDLTTQYELQMLSLESRLATGEIDEQASELAALHEAISVMARRGEDRPHKLIAQHALAFTDDFALAHEAALANWQVQKETSDLLLLAQAAQRADQRQTLAMLRDYQEETGLQDNRLDSLLAGTQR